MLGKKVLSDKYVTKLYNIFKQKNWEIYESSDYSVFDRSGVKSITCPAYGNH